MLAKSVGFTEWRKFAIDCPATGGPSRLEDVQYDFGIQFLENVPYNPSKCTTPLCIGRGEDPTSSS